MRLWDPQWGPGGAGELVPNSCGGCRGRGHTAGRAPMGETQQLPLRFPDSLSEASALSSPLLPQPCLPLGVPGALPQGRHVAPRIGSFTPGPPILSFPPPCLASSPFSALS